MPVMVPAPASLRVNQGRVREGSESPKADSGSVLLICDSTQRSQLAATSINLRLRVEPAVRDVRPFVGSPGSSSRSCRHFNALKTNSLAY